MKRIYQRLLPYFPLAALTLVYLAGGFGQAVVVGQAKYAALGVVTVPLVVAIAMAFTRIRREEKSKETGEE